MSENSRFDLAKLLSPLLPAVFYREYWEVKPLLVSRNHPNYYASLLTLDQIDPLITVFPPDTVLLVNADTQLNVEHMARADGSSITLDVVKACQLFAGGASIIVREAHKRLESLAACWCEAESEFSSPCQINLYMSPPRGKGFDTHYDTHDTFLLQVAGSKEWTIFDSPVQLPLAGQPFDKDLHSIGAPTMSFVLHAGDLLYVPRGFLHHGRSRDDISLHATLGVLSYRWSDVLLESVAQVCLSDPMFRRALPVDLGRPDFDVASARQTFEELILRVTKNASVYHILARLADEFVVSRRAHLPGQLRQVALAQNLTTMDEVGVRPAAIYRLQTHGDVIVIRSHGREVGLPVEAADAIRFALKNDRYLIRDLPGDLDDDDKLTIVRRLIEEGLVWKLACH